jgi:hypothetical protein
MVGRTFGPVSPSRFGVSAGLLINELPQPFKGLLLTRSKHIHKPYILGRHNPSSCASSRALSVAILLARWSEECENGHEPAGVAYELGNGARRTESFRLP